MTNNEYDFPLPSWLKLVLVAIAVLWIAFFLTSCQTQKKVTRYLNENNRFAANYCGLAFPVRDSIIYKPGQTITKSDTSYLPGDSIPCPVVDNYVKTDYVKTKKEKTMYVHCPPNRLIRDTIIRFDTTTIIRENRAKIEAQELTINDLNKKVDKFKQWKARAIWTWVILAVLIGGGIVLKVKSII